MTAAAAHQTSTAVMQYDVARNALAEARTLDEVKNIADRAEAIRVYARQAKDPEMEISLAEIRLRALRRIGELSKELDTIRGEHLPNVPVSGSLSKTKVLADAGLSTSQAHRCEQVASIPEGKFEFLIQQHREQGKAITVDEIVRTVGRDVNRADRMAGIVKALEPLDSLGPFPLIYADPPWQYDYAPSDSRKIETQYPTQTVEEIAALEVPACDDAVLFLWATSPKLREALTVMEAWGFDYKTCMVWDKEKIGMGYYVRGRHELLLIGARGTLPVPEPQNRPHSVVSVPRGKHSEKPKGFYRLIEDMYPELRGHMVELFQRTKRDGWQGWGFEAAA